MAKRKFLWNILLIVLTIIVVPFIVGLIANYISRKKVEITLKLDGWIAVGTLLESDLRNLKLIYNDKPVKNALKISWRIINTGSKGIEKFEKDPIIVYPEDINIAEPRISQMSPLLKIDRELSINSKDRTIGVNNMGVFNEKDFFKVDVYVMNIPDSLISIDFFNDWNLIAKSVDLKIKKDVTFELPEEERGFPWWVLLVAYFTGVLSFLAYFFMVIATIILEGKLKRGR